jgi:hypothetical protein
MMTRRQVSVAERRARVGIRHLLAPSALAADPVAVAEGVVALHATDPASVYLSVAARSIDPTAAAVDAALYDARSLVRMLGMRRTMFVVPTTFVPVVQHSSSDAVAARLRTQLVKELAAVVKDPSRWLDEVDDAAVAVLRAGGPALAADIAKAEPRLRTQLMVGPVNKAYGGPQAITSRVLNLLSAQSRIIRGRPTHGWASSRYRWEVLESWLPDGLPRMAVADARVELVRSWLSRFGPGTLADIVWWTGWNQRDTKAALAGLDLVEVELDAGDPGLVLASDVEPVGATDPWLAFLPALDPTPMGWKERDWYLPESHRRELFDTNGNIGPSIWADGRIVGGWAQAPDGEVRWRLLEDIGHERTAEVAARAAELTAWHDGVVVTPKFRTPLAWALREKPG